MGIESLKESHIKKLVKNMLDDLHCYYFMPVQSGFGSTTLDFLVCYRGSFIGIETKRPGISRLTVRQAATARSIQAAGGIVLIINSIETVESARNFLAARGKILQGGYQSPSYIECNQEATIIWP